MTVKKKAIKPTPIQRDIDNIIERGGKISVDSNNQPEDSEIRFTLRISQKMTDKIDGECQKKVGKVSRNQWIIEAISERLKRDDSI